MNTLKNGNRANEYIRLGHRAYLLVCRFYIRIQCYTAYFYEHSSFIFVAHCTSPERIKKYTNESPTVFRNENVFRMRSTDIWVLYAYNRSSCQNINVYTYIILYDNATLRRPGNVVIVANMISEICAI